MNSKSHCSLWDLVWSDARFVVRARERGLHVVLNDFHRDQLTACRFIAVSRFSTPTTHPVGPKELLRAVTLLARTRRPLSLAARYRSSHRSYTPWRNNPSSSLHRRRVVHYTSQNGIRHTTVTPSTATRGNECGAITPRWWPSCATTVQLTRVCITHLCTQQDFDAWAVRLASRSTQNARQGRRSSEGLLRRKSPRSDPTFFFILP